MTKEKQRSIPFVYKMIVGILLFMVMFVVAMGFGAADTTFKDVWLALTSHATDDKISLIREIRLPREVAGIFVGAALAVSGAIMQGLTRNPLADPSLLGLTAGASATLAITIALLPSANYFYIMIACFVGAAIGALMVFGISAMKKGSFSPLRIVLAGAAVSAFLYAIAEGVGIYFKISKDVSMWTAGGLIGTSWGQLQVIVPFILIGIFTSLLLSRQLTILSLSEEVAAGLGQKTTQIKTVLFVVIILLAGASVALVGNMTFIGLMVPHIVRAIVGTDYRLIIPMSAIAGASFMLFADTLGRTINSPYETPVAAIVAIMGLPFFLFIVHKGGKTLS
ncbi:FecCD family ABC transporter permease [Aneurinibacillus aneurinilyticus]|jgi:iron complex transport system permease protein|uniref:Iron ABC transporter permease n=2 Tax=Aneurinibacillus aneurinilyticus TaxID=1391 RepID=A0A848D208_ANEAE|nr:iron ABC transporter permease [Aneurinibacillus aneurinilyticus]ERI11040.1 putative iron(3+)-hydroxamate import system permease protein FhuB [Aneurinibacillus aneurinilyticus ATCC 12856]MCI1694809.1 iron ABC transporter permease [Aneurinibacillus aneurinilyticus]MED0673734.1 iron ABC transporter permease [Aneurinibacillus aneurinilyticus]MED0708781.1 iron ABC transporter permease [Aneurinibacillus aneurinilyticus]MED0722764.1 iron ABC transporter permease [Aneurinibacillus aneurinilyticus]